MKSRLNTMKYTNKGAYVLWCPTSDGTKINDYRLVLPSGTTSATLVTMYDKNPVGVKTPLSIMNNTVTLSISETPIYVLVNRID